MLRNSSLIGVRRKQHAVSELVELMLRERAVKPVGEWRIFDPRMLRADVICHLVLNDLYAECVRLLDQLAQRRQIAEAIFDGVVIDGVIAVIVSVWTPGLIAAVQAVPVVVPRS